MTPDAIGAPTAPGAFARTVRPSDCRSASVGRLARRSGIPGPLRARRSSTCPPAASAAVAAHLARLAAGLHAGADELAHLAARLDAGAADA